MPPSLPPLNCFNFGKKVNQNYEKRRVTTTNGTKMFHSGSSNRFETVLKMSRGDQFAPPTATLSFPLKVGFSQKFTDAKYFTLIVKFFSHSNVYLQTVEA